MSPPGQSTRATLSAATLIAAATAVSSAVTAGRGVDAAAAAAAAATATHSFSSARTPVALFRHHPQVATTHSPQGLISLQSIPRGGATEKDNDSSENNSKNKPKKSSSNKSGTSKSNSTKKNTSSSSSSSSKDNKTSRRKSEMDNTNTAGDATNHDGKHHQGKGNRRPSSKRNDDADDSIDDDDKSRKTRNDEFKKTVPPPIVEEILQHDDYYEVLGLTKQQILAQTAAKAESMIKKAYRRRALQTHPDKTDGDRRAFDKVAEAYEVLADESKRQAYNRFGKRGVHTHGAGAAPGFSTAEDLFRSFFGVNFQTTAANGNGRRPRGNNPFQNRPNQTLRYQLEVSLEDLYQGATRSILVAPPGSARYFSQQNQHLHKRVQVHIPRGASNGQEILLSGEIDFDPQDAPGDLVFELVQRKHPIFTRKGYDLAVAVNIRFRESITGVRRSLQHLDGRTLVLESARQEHGTDSALAAPWIIKQGDVQVLKGYGMPKDNQGIEFGDLYVQYHVHVPKPTGKNLSPLTPEETQELGRLLDKLEGTSTNTASTQPIANYDTADGVLHLTRALASDFGRASGQPKMPRSHHGHDHNHQDEEHLGGDDEYNHPFHPFFAAAGGGGSQFFFSSSTHFNPFFGMRNHHASGTFQDGGEAAADDDNDGVQQCQQM